MWATAASGKAIDPSLEFGEWLAWALRHADLVDPLRRLVDWGVMGEER